MRVLYQVVLEVGDDDEEEDEDEDVHHVRRPVATSRIAGASSPGTTSAGTSMGTWRSVLSRSTMSAGASTRSSKPTRTPLRQISAASSTWLPSDRQTTAFQNQHFICM